MCHDRDMNHFNKLKHPYLAAIGLAICVGLEILLFQFLPTWALTAKTPNEIIAVNIMILGAHALMSLVCAILHPYTNDDYVEIKQRLRRYVIQYQPPTREQTAAQAKHIREVMHKFGYLSIFSVGHVMAILRPSERRFWEASAKQDAELFLKIIKRLEKSD